MAKKFLDLVGLEVFKNKLIKEMMDSCINESTKIEIYNDYWVTFAPNNGSSNINEDIKVEVRDNYWLVISQTVSDS